jgi:micrococcal nuclease
VQESGFFKEVIILHSITVKVNKVIDGDTFRGDAETHIHGLELVMLDQCYRLIGIDAPELSGEERTKGLESKEFLENWIEGKEVQVSAERKDKYGRWLATVFYEGYNINDELVKRGYAIRREY